MNITMSRALLTKLILILASAALLVPSPALSVEAGADERWSKEEKVTAFNTASVAALLTWGALVWDYGENPPHSRSEGWFGESTKHGGADKTGHVYVAYLLARAPGETFIKWGYDRDEAAFLGAFSSVIFTTIMEAGDSFSDFGLSPQDLVSNFIGTAVGYVTVKYPEIGKFIDLRVEYCPHELKNDPTTDYEHMKHLIAFKLSGFDSLQESWLRFFEFNLGYYTRGFHGPSTGSEERNLFIGFGVDLSELFKPTSAGTVFRYLQVPGTYLHAEKTY